MKTDRPPRLRRDVRPDDRRPRAPGRHRPGRSRSSATYTHLRRRGEVRRRQGDPRRHGAEPARAAPSVADTVITNARDRRPLGHRQGRHRHQGRAHRRHRQGRQSRRAAGRRHRHRPGHRDHRRRRLIVTAGGIDTHIHFICPQQIEDALMSRRHDDDRRRHRPGRPAPTRPPARRARGTSRACCRRPTRFPMNLGFLGKGNASLPEALRRADRGRRLRPEAARGLGHDAGGDRLLPGGRRRARRAGRDPHRHAQRSGLRRGHASRRSRAARSTPTTPRAPAAATRPTSSRRCGVPNVLPSSTNPTRPYTVNTVDEHLDMLMVCHHLDPGDRRGRRVRRDRASAARPSPPRTSCTTSARSA